jgi:hypothetical protein
MIKALNISIFFFILHSEMPFWSFLTHGRTHSKVFAVAGNKSISPHGGAAPAIGNRTRTTDKRTKSRIHIVFPDKEDSIFFVAVGTL